MSTTLNYSRGFIALISVIIISLVLLIMAVSASTSSFTTRFDILHAEYKERGIALADSCVSQVLLRLAYDPAYPSGYALPETLIIGSDTCRIISGSGNVFAIQARFQDSYTNIQLTVDPNIPAVTAYQELTTY
jgi:uncharacterized membrane protein YdfJ with MMPL/SSD domain